MPWEKKRDTKQCPVAPTITRQSGRNQGTAERTGRRWTLLTHTVCQWERVQGHREMNTCLFLKKFDHHVAQAGAALLLGVSQKQ